MMVEVKFLHATLWYGCCLHSFYLLDELKFASWRTVPDGLCVDVHRSNPLQQELHHFQEWIAGLFGAAKFFSDVSLKGRQLRTSIYLCSTNPQQYEDPNREKTPPIRWPPMSRHFVATLTAPAQGFMTIIFSVPFQYFQTKATWSDISQLD